MGPMATWALWPKSLPMPCADIFRGLVLTHGLLLPKQVFIPAENVVGVADRRVQVNLTKAQAEHLSPPTFTTSETQATDI